MVVGRVAKVDLKTLCSQHYQRNESRGKQGNEKKRQKHMQKIGNVRPKKKFDALLFFPWVWKEGGCVTANT